MRSLVVTLLLAGCSLGDPAVFEDGGGPVSDGDAGGAASEPDGAELDGDAGGSGPITLVVERISALLDRRCDLDGDGVGDNAVADIGDPGASLVSAAIGAALTASIERGNRWILHIPWVEDSRGPSDPDVVVVTGGGLNEESCGDGDSICARRVNPPGSRDDDFSGEQGFWIKSESLDDCGEPASYALGGVLDQGELDAELGDTVLRIALSGTRIWGTIAPRGSSATLAVCGTATARSLAGERAGDVGDELSLLDVLVAGGGALGIPGLPGVQPDVDFDGDGLERLVVGEDGHIGSCVDGDDTVLPAPGCLWDARIADGFSLVLETAMVSARFLGRDPYWQSRECGAAIGGSGLSPCLSVESCPEDVLERACPSSRPLLTALHTCSEEACATECDGGLEACVACWQDRCPEELAACQEAECCPSPPETSVLEPR